MKRLLPFDPVKQKGIKPSGNTSLNHAVAWILLMDRFRDHGCAGCSICASRLLGPVLQDEIWRHVCLDQREVLCQDCIESRLGRPLKAEDLKPVVWNQYRTAFLFIIDSYEKGE